MLGCTKEKDDSIVLNQSFSMKKGTKACTADNEVCIQFEKVAGDSRCPLRAMCIWEGVAEANFILTYKNVDYPFTLHTLDKLQFSSDTVLQGYTIKLEQLSPYPEGGSIEQKEYVAQLTVSK